MGVLHEAVRQLAHMHQPILVHADVNESAEGRDIGDGAFERHAGLQVLDGFDTLGEGCRLEARARVAARLLEFGQNVLHRRKAERGAYEYLRLEAAELRRIAHEAADVAAAGFHDLARHAIGFRVNGRCIERFRAITDAQEARRLLERLGAETRDLEQVLPGGEGAIGMAVVDDRLRKPGAQPRHIGQQRGGCGVEIDTHRVHRVFHHGLERAAELELVDVMLILTNANRLRLDLDEFRQRVLQAARDRDSAAQRHVKRREFLGCQLGGRIDGGTRFRNDDLGGRFHALRQQRQRVGHEALGLAARRAVADRNQLDAMLSDEAQQRCFGAAQVILRREGIERVGREQLAGGINHRRLDAGADARVQPQRGARTGGGRKKKILQVAGKDGNRLLLGARPEIAHQVDHHGDGELHAPRPVGHVAQPLVTGLGASDADGAGDDVCRARTSGFRNGRDVECDNFFLGGAQHGECPVRGHLGPRLTVIEVVGELCALLFLACDDLGREERVRPHEGAEFTKQCGTFGQPLHEDVARAIERFLHRLHSLGDEGQGQHLRFRRAIGQNGVDQGFEAILAGDHRLGAALRLVGEIDVFKFGFRCHPGDGQRQLIRELALRADRFGDGLAPVLEFAEVDEALGQLAELRVIEAAGHFLAVARDEGDGGTFIQQVHGGGNLTCLGADLSGDGLENLCGAIQNQTLDSNGRFRFKAFPAGAESGGQDPKISVDDRRSMSAASRTTPEICISWLASGLVLRQIMPMVREGCGAVKRASDTAAERVSTGTAISGMSVTPMPALTIWTRVESELPSSSSRGIALLMLQKASA